MSTRIIDTANLAEALENELTATEHCGLFVVTDSNVKEMVLPRLASVLQKHKASIISFTAGEENKNLETLSQIWRKLSDNGATRKSLIINLGGGVVTDLGGFAAATFKRGIQFINIPTTVLGAVDAAVGGKTGIDFNGLKNEVGAFALPRAVMISSEPLCTLPQREIKSGFGEIVKTALITSEDFYAHTLAGDILSDNDSLRNIMTMSVAEKQRITDEDPLEKGLRKTLNFGHTAGHAFETMMMARGATVSHGEAVANGILVALILSHMLTGMTSGEIYRYRDGILRRHFSPIAFGCKDYEELTRLISHDKKNPSAGDIRFVLLESIGKPLIDIPVTVPDLHTAFDIYRDLTGIG